MARSTATARDALAARRQELAEATVEKHFGLLPHLAERYGSQGRQKCHEDALYHLSYLAEALGVGSPSLFTDYVAWAAVMLESRGIPVEHLVFNLACLRDVLAERLPEEAARVAGEYLEAGAQRLAAEVTMPPSFLQENDELDDVAQRYLARLLAADRRGAQALIAEVLDAGWPLQEIYERVFERTQREVGSLWQLNRISVAQEHFCTAATQQIMAGLYHRIVQAEPTQRTAVVTCAGGEFHQIGTRMVADFLEMDGWDVLFLGANTPASSIVDMVAEHRARLLGISATVAPNVRTVVEIIEAVRASEQTAAVKVLVGGNPFMVDPDLWRLVGADAMAASARDAVEVAGRLVTP
jgi:MerR family transcriptional regulator, light-induced transcriptional regulator